MSTWSGSCKRVRVCVTHSGYRLPRCVSHKIWWQTEFDTNKRILTHTHAVLTCVFLCDSYLSAFGFRVYSRVMCISRILVSIWRTMRPGRTSPGFRSVFFTVRSQKTKKSFTTPHEDDMRNGQWEERCVSAGPELV